MDILSRFEGVTQRWPEHAAFIDQSGICTFESLAVQAQGCAAFLRDIGVLRGCRCIVSEDNSSHTAIIILAIWHCGAIPVLVHAQSTQAHLERAIVKTDAKLIVSKMEAVASTEPTRANRFTADELIEALKRKQPSTRMGIRSSVPDSMIASIVFTSGSSGGPKGVAQTHQSLMSGCRSVFHCLKYQPTDTILCPVPWSFDYGFGQLLTTLQFGITQIIPASNSPFSICDSIEEHRPSILVGVPSLFAGLCQGLTPIADTDTSSVRLITSTGSRIHASTIKALGESFPDSAVSLNYGLTETYRSTSLPVDAFGTHPTSVGLPVPGVDITIIRPDNSTADPGEIGEIVHRGGGIFSGYWGDPAKTQSVRRADPLWSFDEMTAPPAVFTGDLGWKDDNGFLFIKGRRDRQIKTMGILVSPDEIETLLLDQEQLLEAAVISRTHEMLGELIIAVYVLKPESVLPQKAMKRFCRKHMSPYMMPREFHQLMSLPRTSTGKVDYPQLIEHHKQPSDDH